MLLADEVARRLGEYHLGESGLYLIIRHDAPEQLLASCSVVENRQIRTIPAAFREGLAGPLRYDALHPTCKVDLYFPPKE